MLHPAAEQPGSLVEEPGSKEEPNLQAEVERLKAELERRTRVEEEGPSASGTIRLGRARWWVLLLVGSSATAGAGAEAGMHALRKDEVVSAAEDWRKLAQVEQQERRAALELLRSELATRLAGLEGRVSDGEDWTAAVLEQACDVEVGREMGVRARGSVQVSRPIGRRTQPKVQVLTPQPAGSR